MTVKVKIEQQNIASGDRWSALVDIGDAQGWRSLGTFLSEDSASDAVAYQVPQMLGQWEFDQHDAS